MSAPGAASAAQSQVAELQKSIQALRQEARANREAMARLTQDLQEAQGSAEQIRWLWGGMAVLGGLSLFLFLRSRRLQSDGGPPVWWSTAVPAPQVGPGVSIASTALPPQAPQKTRPTMEPQSSLGTDTSLDLEPKGNLADREPGLAFPPRLQPGQVAEHGPTHRATPNSAAAAGSVLASIDDVLELVQQVEFFTTLGQPQSALGLLSNHVDRSAGPYPLPHLQLLELLRQTGDQSAYETERARLKQRFGLAWPAWNQAALSRRQLEDVPEVLLEVQQAWPDPARAAELLERLLRSTDRHADLHPAAQGDLLLLFSLARDLQQHPVSAEPATDIGLPRDAWRDEGRDRPAALAVQTAGAPIHAGSLTAARAVDITLDLDLGYDASVSASALLPSQGITAPAADLTLTFHEPEALGAPDPARHPVSSLGAGPAATDADAWSDQAPAREFTDVDLPAGASLRDSLRTGMPSPEPQRSQAGMQTPGVTHSPGLELDLIPERGQAQPVAAPGDSGQTHGDGGVDFLELQPSPPAPKRD